MYGIIVYGRLNGRFHQTLTDKHKDIIQESLGKLFVMWDLENSHQVFITSGLVVDQAVRILNDLGFETDDDDDEEEDCPISYVDIVEHDDGSV